MPAPGWTYIEQIDAKYMSKAMCSSAGSIRHSPNADNQGNTFFVGIVADPMHAAIVERVEVTGFRA